MTETFVDILEKEEKYGIFRNYNAKISIKELIGEFSPDTVSDTLSAWRAFRKTDSAAHIGLMMFKNTLKRCQYKNLQIISNTSRDLEKDNEFVWNINNVDKQPRHVIPGTQIYFSIPVITIVNSLPVNLVQLANNGAFSEDHNAFAVYLDYTVSDKIWDIQMTLLNNESSSFYKLDVTNAESKMKALNKWKDDFWLKLMEASAKDEKKIHLCNAKDFHFLGNRDNCEVFIKGFFAAASLYSKKKSSDDAKYYPLCFHLENLPAHFMDIFVL
jgi:hypothetical protein